MDGRNKIQKPLPRALSKAKALQQNIKHLKKQLLQLQAQLKELRNSTTVKKIPYPQYGEDLNNANQTSELSNSLEQFLQKVAEFIKTLSSAKENSQEMLDCYFNMVRLMIPVKMSKICKYLKQIESFERRLQLHINELEQSVDMENRFDISSTKKIIHDTPEDRVSQGKSRKDSHPIKSKEQTASYDALAKKECQRIENEWKELLMKNRRSNKINSCKKEKPIERQHKISTYDMVKLQQEFKREEREWKSLFRKNKAIDQPTEDPEHLKELLECVEAQIRLKEDIADMEAQMNAAFIRKSVKTVKKSKGQNACQAKKIFCMKPEVRFEKTEKEEAYRDNITELDLLWYAYRDTEDSKQKVSMKPQSTVKGRELKWI